MPSTTPLNPHLLWSSKMPAHKRLVQPPMDLPKINSLTGIPYKVSPSIHDMLTTKSQNESAAYWAGVNTRKTLYRNNRDLYTRLYNAPRCSYTLGTHSL